MILRARAPISFKNWNSFFARSPTVGLYVRAHWDEVDALCKPSGIPFNATGERIHNGGLWCVRIAFDTMQFWDRFEER